MLEQIRSERFQDLIGNSQVFDFGRRVITSGYVGCVPRKEKAGMRELLETAFAALLDQYQDDQAFQETTARLVRDVFRKQDPDFWFNRTYTHYKRSLKPAFRLAKIRSWQDGGKILDFGCGNGLTGAILHESGYEVMLTDVLDYRDPAAHDLPFAQLSGTRFPAEMDGPFDAAIVMAVLHHVEAGELKPLLDELRRTCRRLIVEEDSYGLPSNLPGLAERLEVDPFLREFTCLPVENQLRFLMFIDYFSNAITQGIAEMDLPFNFRPVREWEMVFAESGFSVRSVRPFGFQAGQFNQSCHVWFLCE